MTMNTVLIYDVPMFISDKNKEFTYLLTYHCDNLRYSSDFDVNS